MTKDKATDLYLGFGQLSPFSQRRIYVYYGLVGIVDLAGICAFLYALIYLPVNHHPMTFNYLFNGSNDDFDNTNALIAFAFGCFITVIKIFYLIVVLFVFRNTGWKMIYRIYPFAFFLPFIGLVGGVYFALITWKASSIYRSSTPPVRTPSGFY
ncbi:hypothetical protein [[Mycoplasma] testudinis]|uniref:hypothetical protein n=1 Tax=[Mycoplasma] testudinis TaxID=33924 RepID=UPI000480E494|nr:hypothetical protein [[Mycoplasma] testudinis]